MKRLALVIFTVLFLASGAAAQGEKKGYMVTDPNGRGVYLIPEVIAGKTVDATLSLPAPAPESALRSEAAYFVQVGAFAVPANAERLVRRLENERYRVLVSKAVFQRRKLSVDVVTVGGFATLEEAERVKSVMRSSYGLEALIVPPGAGTLALQ